MAAFLPKNKRITVQTPTFSAPKPDLWAKQGYFHAEKVGFSPISPRILGSFTADSCQIREESRPEARFLVPEERFSVQERGFLPLNRAVLHPEGEWIALSSFSCSMRHKERGR